MSWPPWSPHWQKAGVTTHREWCEWVVQVHFRILPRDSYRLMYNIVPLTSGNVQLPKFHLNMPRHPEPVTTAVYKMLPNTVFVLVRRAIMFF